MYAGCIAPAGKENQGKSYRESVRIVKKLIDAERVLLSVSIDE